MGGYNESNQDPLIRTEMDSGPEHVRQRFTAVETQTQGIMYLTTAQVTTLETFYKTTSRYGSILFNWTHPRTGATVEARFKAPPVFVPLSKELIQVNLAIDIIP